MLNYRSKQVIGIDINPMLQTDAVPANLYLQVDDLNRRYMSTAYRRTQMAN